MQTPDDLAAWSLHCFCLGAPRPPQHLIRRRGLGRALFAAADWCDAATLRQRGLPVAAEDLAVLEDYALIERRGARLRCAFPRLGPATLAPLRAQAGAAAGALLDGAAGQIAALAAELARLGLAPSFYAVLFGHVFDGLLWQRLAQVMTIPETAPDPAHPHWRGVFWALYPAVAGAIGTNEYGRGGARLTLVWSQATSAMLDALRRQDWPGGLLGYLSGGGGAPPPGAVRAGLCSPAGEAMIPVFGDARCAALAGLCGGLAGWSAGFIAEHWDAWPDPGGMSAPQRNVILVHELIWALQGAFAARPRPEGAAPGGAAPPRDLRGSVIAHIAPR